MTVELTIKIVPPFVPGDKDVLGGISMLLYALVQGGEEAPTSSSDEEEKTTPEETEEQTAARAASLGLPDAAPAPCGKEGKAGTICIGVVGHRGRHLFRTLNPGMVN